MTAVVTRAEYTEKIERLLEDAKKRFQEMELEQMRKGEVKARAALAAAREHFDEKKKQVEAELVRARESGGSAWDEVKDGLESAWDELLSSINRARGEFKSEVESTEKQTA